MNKNRYFILISCGIISAQPYDGATQQQTYPSVTFHNNNSHTIIQRVVRHDGTPYGTIATTLTPHIPYHPERVGNDNHHVIMQDHHGDNSFSDNRYAAWLPAIAAPSFLAGKQLYITLAAGCIGASYLYTLSSLIYASYYTVEQEHGWASWKAEMPVEILIKIEPTVAQELLSAIQQRYAQAPRTACFLSPLVHFVNDTDNELALLNRFIQLHTTINRCRLSWLFPTQQQAINKAIEKVKRLEYLKQLMVKSVGHYKVEEHGVS